MMEKKDAMALPQSRIDQAIDESKLPADFKEKLRPVMREHFAPYEQQAAEWVETALALVVTDANETEKIAQAKEGAKFLQRVRISIDKLREQLKESHLRSGQAIDLASRTLISWIEPAEKHLQQQMKFVEIQEEKRKQELQKSRLEALAPYRYEGDQMDDMPLSEMAEQAFKNLLMGMKVGHETRIKEKEDADKLKAQQEKDAADERERIKRLNGRIDDLSRLDFKPNGDSYTHNALGLSIARETVINVDDESFEKMRAEFSVKVTAYNEKVKEDQDKELRIKNRINAMASLGFMWDEKGKRYHHPKHLFELSAEDLKTISADDFRSKYADYQMAIKNEQEREKKLETRIQKLIDTGFTWDGNCYFVGDFKRLDKQTIQTISDDDFNGVVAGGAAEVKRLKDIADNEEKMKRAPDKAKLLHYADTLEQNKPLAITDPFAHKILTQAVKEVERITAWIRTEANKL